VPPPLPPGGVQTGQGDWTVSGIKTGFSLVDAFTDYAFEGEYSHTSLEWVPLKDLTFDMGKSKDEPKYLGTLKPIHLEEEVSPSGRRSFLFGEDDVGPKTCSDLYKRGHVHVLAIVRRYETAPPPLPAGLDPVALKDLCVGWYWAPKLRQALQRVCQSEDDVICCSTSLADKDGSTRPLLTIKKVSMADVEEEKGAAKVFVGGWSFCDHLGSGQCCKVLWTECINLQPLCESIWYSQVWVGLVELDRKADLDSDPFGTLANVFNVEVETDKMSKVVKGKAEDVALQIKVILSCFS